MVLCLCLLQTGWSLEEIYLMYFIIYDLNRKIVSVKKKIFFAIKFHLLGPGDKDAAFVDVSGIFFDVAVDVDSFLVDHVRFRHRFDIVGDLNALLLKAPNSRRNKRLLTYFVRKVSLHLLFVSRLGFCQTRTSVAFCIKKIQSIQISIKRLCPKLA